MPARPEHIPQILEIEYQSFSQPWSAESFRKEFEDELARYFVAAKLPQTGAGIEIIAGYCGYWSILDEAHITNIAVLPGLRGQGLGTGLISAMLCDVVVNGHKSATLEVRCDNYPAIRLYERFGFKCEGVRKKYYDNGKKDALIMWKKFE